MNLLSDTSIENNYENEGRLTLFVEVILPLAISKNYTYRIPYELNIEVKVGKRVVVQFGKNKVYTALIYKIGTRAPELYEAKYILSILDNEPITTENQLHSWEWMASYYMCSIGEIMNAALPSALKLASETRITLNREAEFDKSLLTDKEFLVVDALDIKAELTLNDIIKLLGQKTVMPIIKSLSEKRIIMVIEELQQGYKPRIESFVSLNPTYFDQDRLRDLFQVLERAPKQVDLLMTYLRLSKLKKEVSKKGLLEESASSPAVFNALVEKEIFSLEKKEVSRFKTDEIEIIRNFELSAAQQDALETIQAGFTENRPVLLQGVTSSGKTQLYIRLIEACIQQGKQSLYLLPEIALTAQMIERLKAYFGDKIGIYHSKFNDNERAEVWKKVLKGEYRIVLGARSSIFLPFTDLGLIIVDEEHENSYKQYDPAPRYNARDIALYLSKLHTASIVLGSATPSLESYFNVKSGRYRLASLQERYGGVKLPEIVITDLAQERKQRSMKSHFSGMLFRAMEQALERKEQIILFQNRRGYAPMLVCSTCAYTPKCVQCDISLTYHKHDHKLHCHYCGYKQTIFHLCPACGGTQIEQKGFGTEKIEDELAILLPNARITRMDLDTTRTKFGYQQIINDFEDRKIDILVGTQMVTKGLDFENVSLIGILNADAMLNFPDFRAFERSFQLMTQVSGRAGRRSDRGKVIIQTYQPQHKIIDWVKHNDIQSLYKSELAERSSFHYPPYFRLIQLDIKHKEIEKLNAAADMLGRELKQQLGNRVLGPEFPLVNRIRNLYIKTLLIKIEKENISLSRVKQVISESIAHFYRESEYKTTIIKIDVDPY
ncbi:replication restart helicase PriA [Solitalea koreensis]|uniref:Replication restart protein PriA n=1 Tax=Solitalea koreensis TaxID=543615 RepID=A0A521EBZ6_9SPHI|nr:primosomal protein N' [Solitalea koreensis]SMO81464.1 replication restart DNA helicase PriA [Solitalea koreensis]